jgi:cellulose synthase/poly-beta-1,6-N-acetylglucosamine synthase-like glycosyltransferase/peptidoglycan/xylan/chitin deacetylase (PgdA/CDA1 family)
VVLLAGLTASLALQELLSTGSSGRRLGDAVFDDTVAAGPVGDFSGTPLRWATGDPRGVGIALVDVGDRAAADRAAAVLERHGTPASWFLSGRTIADHADLVDLARRDGGEIGVTGYTGRDLAELPDWRLRLELSTTQAALAAHGRVTSSLLLLPVSSSAGRIDAPAFRAARTAARQGYGLVVGFDPGEVVAGQVAIVPLDDRADERLEALVQRLDLAGLEPMAVSRVAGMTDTANRPVTTWARANGQGLLVADRLADLVVGLIGALFWPVAILLSLRALAGVVAAVFHARHPPGGDWAGPVTVIVPAYNEAAGIEDTVMSLVESDWPFGLEVIVVDDGSTDGTGDIVRRLDIPGVWLVQQPNAGKPAALNAAIAAARTDIVVMVDGDTMFEPDTISRLVAPFSDPRVGACSGNAKVWNRRRLLGRWQHIEYVMGFNLDRRLLAVCHAIPTVPGAIGAFRTGVLRAVGGVSDDTLAEDTDLTIAITRAGWRVVYVDDALAWTEAPFTAGDLWRQRYRWSYGTLQAMWKHRAAVRERRGIGLVGMPYAWIFQVTLPLLGPVADVAALYSLVSGGSGAVLVTWLIFTLTHLALGVIAFRLDRERLGPLWALPFQQFFYRQLMYLVAIQSVLSAITGTRLRWHKVRRLDASVAATT